MNIGKVFGGVAKQVAHEADNVIDQAKGSMPKVDVPDIHKDVMQRFDSVANLYGRFNEASKSALGDAHLPRASAQLLKQMQNTVSDRRLEAQIYGPQAAMKQISKETKRAEKGLHEPPDGDWGKGTTIWQHDLYKGSTVWSKDWQNGGSWGSAFAKGEVDILKAQVRVFGDFKLDKNDDGGIEGLTADIGAQARLALLDAGGQLGYATPNVDGHGSAFRALVNVDAFVGAQASIEACLKLGAENTLTLGGGAFAGACASIEGSAHFGDLFGVNARATAWVGFGIKEEIDVGLKDGDFKFSNNSGAACILGVDFDWGFDVNYGKVLPVLEGALDQKLVEALFSQMGGVAAGMVADAMGPKTGHVDGPDPKNPPPPPSNIPSGIS